MSDTIQLDNRMIAERAGYQLHQRRDGLWLLHAPSGAWAQTYNGAPVAWETIDPAWDGAPDFLGSVDAALTLITGDLTVSLHNEDAPLWTAVVARWVDGYWEQRVASADTPAAAVCAAWWAWREMMEAES